MDFKEYKKYHEKHMMNNMGTSMEECGILISTIPFCIFLSSFVASYNNKKGNCSFEFLMIILPVILNSTILSDLSLVIFLVVVLLSFILIVKKIDINRAKNLFFAHYEGKSIITLYRASTNFVSAICILAVDFTIFPKRFSKTETFGFGFMDLGVGFYICSNGFIEKPRVTQEKFTKLIKTVSILCTLGLIRVLSLKITDYHEHVSEYGVHWNFFFTLALCRLLSYLIKLLTNDANLIYLSIITGLAHQVLLLLGVQKWIISDHPRNSFLTANREGLFSILGYVSLYFAASATGKYMFHSKNLTYGKLITKLFLICTLLWIGTAVSVKTVGVSRRLVNAGYIFWILALSLTELILFMIMEISLLSLRKRKKINVFLTVPTILESINAYGLLFFILSNLLTGIINSYFQTLLLGEITSLIIIINYMIILCSITHLLFLKKFPFIYKFVRI